MAVTRSFMLIVLCVVATAFLLYQEAWAGWNVSKADVDGDGAADLTVENDLLKATVGGRGGELQSLRDLLRNREESKTFPTGNSDGLNQVRLRGVDTGQVPHDLASREEPDGTLVIEARASIRVTQDEQFIEPVVLTRRYTFEPDSTRIKIQTQLVNNGKIDWLLMPWVKHLLLRDMEKFARVSFVTPYGVWESEKPIFGRGGLMYKSSSNVHYLTASNWISRTIEPGSKPANTLSTVTRPDQMFKVYTWRKASEEFLTQEVIFAPVTLRAGSSAEFNYYLTLSEPILTPAYCSPLLNIGVDPHPTGLPASTTELTFQFAVTKPLGKVQAVGKVVRVDAKEEPQTFQFDVDDLNPRSIGKAVAPVKLADKGRYHVELQLQRDGKPFLPGAEIGDNDPVLIPLVVGISDPTEVVYQDRMPRESLFPKLARREVIAQLVGEKGPISAFRLPTTERCFETDVPKAESSSAGPVELVAAANEYESAQIVLTLKEGQSPRTLSVNASQLTGPGSAKVAVDHVSRFLYAETKVPSRYYPGYPVGRYPDGLLPTTEIELKPGVTAPLYITYFVPAKTPPGVYQGHVTIGQGNDALTVPVSLRVWDIELPTRPFIDVSVATKSGGTQVIPMYLKYKASPTPLPEILNPLLQGDFATVEKVMPGYLEQGLTKLYLGYSDQLLDKSPGESRIREIEAFLKQHGWADHFYVRVGMDEASMDRVGEMRRRAERWSKVSTIPVMETYYYDEGAEQLFGHLDIYARSFSKAPWIQERIKAGDQFWRVNAFPSAVEVPLIHPWVQYMQMADHGYTGTYIWTFTAWRELEWGKDWWADDGVGNLEASLIWKHETGLLPSVRLEAFRDAVEGNTLLTLLKKRIEQPRAGDDPQLVAKAKALLGDPPLWERIKNGHDVDRLRREVGDVLSGLNDRAGAARTE